MFGQETQGHQMQGEDLGCWQCQMVQCHAQGHTQGQALAVQMPLPKWA